MNIRETNVKNKYGSVYTYLQLVHNHRDKKSGKTITEVLLNIGRKDRLSLEFIQNVVDNLNTLLPSPSPTGGLQFAFRRSKTLGGVWLLDALWRRLGMDKALCACVKDRKFRSPVERMAFALVAGRILDHSSKLSLEHWVSDLAYLRDLESVDVHYLYRVMDFMIESGDELQRSVFKAVAKSEKLDVDIVFLDTTNTYFETMPDDDDEGFKKFGHSKDNHAELPLASIAFAVTRNGIPVRHWVFPGNTSDQTIVETVKDGLSDWNIGNVIMVSDAGFNSEDNRRIMRRECGDFIVGEKLRQGSKGALVEALHRQGRFRNLENGLSLKDVVEDKGLSTQRRFIIVRSDNGASYDRSVREDIVKEAQHRLELLAQSEGEAHKKAACALRAHSVFGRYIKQSVGGVLSIDQDKINSDALLDGKFLISTSNMKLKADDVVAGYKQLWCIERIFRDMKGILKLRPVYHRLEDRIRCHVFICWLAMILIRVAEHGCGKSWHYIEKQMSKVTAGEMDVNGFEWWVSSDVPEEAQDIFEKLKVSPPPQTLSVAKKA